MPVRHAWESDAAGSAAPSTHVRHAWEQVEEYEDSGSESDADPESDPKAAAAQMLDELFELYYSSAISAQYFCTICYWAAKSGVQGAVHSYGRKPGYPAAITSAISTSN